MALSSKMALSPKWHSGRHPGRHPGRHLVRHLVQMAPSPNGLGAGSSVPRVHSCPLATTYKLALKQLNIERLDLRREEIFLKFGIKALKSERFCNWFTPKEGNKYPPKTRKQETQIVNKLKPVTTRTRRFEKSPIPYLTELLNNNPG